MQFGFVNKDTRSNKKYQIKFAPKLQYVKEIAGNNFEGTSMFSAAIYEFDNNISKTTIIEDINGNTIEKVPTISLDGLDSTFTLGLYLKG